MSGHSKWSQIKRQKGVSDVKRGQSFTKLSNAITITVREAGGIGDPNSNFKLRLAVEKARAANMPKENIARAIEKGQGKGGGEALEHGVYEGFGPGGVAVIVETVSDNKQRTAPEVKNVFDKNGGILANPGAVSYQFSLKGQITIKKNDKTIDDIFLLAADRGAEDIEEAGEEVIVYTKPDELSKVKEGLVSEGITVVEAELTRKPSTFVAIENKEIAQKLLSFIDKLEDLDDVQKVYANFDITDETINDQLTV